VAGELVRRGPFLLHFANSQLLSALLGRALGHAPLTADDFAVYSLLRITGATTPSRLRGDLGMPASTLSNYLRRMTERGHLDRRPNPDDGRSSLVVLTPEGVAATEACYPGFHAAITAFREHLAMPEDALLSALDVMGRALAAAEHDITAPPPPVARRRAPSRRPPR
jgi:DNA-binding MarR family transcriptional regulator